MTREEILKGLSTGVLTLEEAGELLDALRPASKGNPPFRMRRCRKNPDKVWIGLPFRAEKGLANSLTLTKTAAIALVANIGEFKRQIDAYDAIPLSKGEEAAV